MTQIDPHADIDIGKHDDHVTVRIPLDGDVSQLWHRRYLALARAKDVPARVQELPGRTWIVVTMPLSTDRAEVHATMDAARSLIAGADIAEQSTAAAETEALVRAWWTHQTS